MKRFFQKIERFFWSWGFLKFVLWTATLVILFYVEEDWRGAHAWAATKAKWEARGVSFDPNSYIPPPVPDAENLAVLPLFKLVPDPENKDNFIPAALEKALHHDSNRPDLYSPVLEHGWTEGKPPNFDKLDRDIAAYYLQIFAKPPASSDPLVQFEAIYPFITELNSAVAMRPYFRLEEDYDSPYSRDRSLWLATSQIRIVQKLEIHAMLALHEKRPELALTDINTMVKMSAGMSRARSLVSGLVSIGLCSITTVVVNYGLGIHAWNDVQLAEIQEAYGTLDLLTDCQHVLRGELITYAMPQFVFYKKQGFFTKNILHFSSSPSRDDISNFSIFPNGWLDQNLSLTANGMLGAAAQVDPRAHRVFVDQAERVAKQWTGGWTKFAPWNILFATAFPAILNAQIQFLHGQMWIDEVRMACGLERYRLIHGIYPDSLDALVPACIDALPCDPINGQLYRYRVKPDGTFLLYSIDWNQKDDGGVYSFSARIFVAKPAGSTQPNGDWPWPILQSGPQESK